MDKKTIQVGCIIKSGLEVFKITDIAIGAPLFGKVNPDNLGIVVSFVEVNTGEKGEFRRHMLTRILTDYTFEVVPPDKLELL